MSLWKIAWRSIQQRALASSLTALSMALGVALVIAVLVALGVVSDSFKRGAGGYHLVVGKKGSQLQLVLNTVYHLQEPIENLPYPFYKEFLNTPEHKGKFAPYVQTAIPYCLGDNYEGFRVVGTVADLFDKLDHASGKKYEFQAGGRNFEPDHFFEAVIGATVAQKTGLKVGDEFQPTHGTSDEGDGHKHDPFKIVGILKPTGTANDRALFINIEGFYLLDNHAKDAPLDAAARDERPADGEKHDAHDADHHHDEAAEHGHPHDAEHDHAADEHRQDEAGHDHDAEHEHKDAPHDHDDHGHDEVTAGGAAAEARAQEATGHAAREEDAHDHAHENAEAGHADHDHADHDHADHDHDHAGMPGDAHEHGDHDHDSHDHAGHDHDAHDHAGHGHDGQGHDGQGHDHDHAGHHHHEPLPENQREVTSILVLANNDLNAVSLRTMINEGETAQAVFPVKVISEFFDTLVRGISIALLSLTVLIIVVAGVGVMVSIYNSMNDRRRDIAVMRALGAGRQTVLSVILLESILLAVGGGVLGFALGHVLIGVLGPVVEAFTGVRLGFAQFVPYELILIPGLIVLAALAGYLPAMSAYRTDVAKALSASP